MLLVYSTFGKLILWQSFCIAEGVKAETGALQLLYFSSAFWNAASWIGNCQRLRRKSFLMLMADSADSNADLQATDLHC